MQKKIKHENDIHWSQSPSSQGKNGDIPWISRISTTIRNKFKNNVLDLQLTGSFQCKATYYNLSPSAIASGSVHLLPTLNSLIFMDFHGFRNVIQ